MHGEYFEQKQQSQTLCYLKLNVNRTHCLENKSDKKWSKMSRARLTRKRKVQKVFFKIISKIMMSESGKNNLI